MIGFLKSLTKHRIQVILWETTSFYGTLTNEYCCKSSDCQHTPNTRHLACILLRWHVCTQGTQGCHTISSWQAWENVTGPRPDDAPHCCVGFERNITNTGSHGLTDSHVGAFVQANNDLRCLQHLDKPPYRIQDINWGFGITFLPRHGPREQSVFSHEGLGKCWKLNRL